MNTHTHISQCIFLHAAVVSFGQLHKMRAPLPPLPPSRIRIVKTEHKLHAPVKWTVLATLTAYQWSSKAMRGSTSTTNERTNEQGMRRNDERNPRSNMNTTTPFPRVIISIFVASVYGTGTVSLFIISKSLAPANGWTHSTHTAKRGKMLFFGGSLAHACRMCLLYFFVQFQFTDKKNDTAS